MAKRGLGKGLDALFPSYDEPVISVDKRDDAVREIKISDIDPNVGQPRKSFDEDKIKELALSIQQHGVVQPIIVKPHNNRYLLIAGERRWRAARVAGITKIPAIIKDVDEKEVVEIALIENIQREDLNPIEEALGIKVLMDEHGLTQEMVGEKIGRSRPAITNTLRLLTLQDKIQNLVVQGKLSSGHARALLALQDKKQQWEVAELIMARELSVRETEKVIQRINSDKDDKRQKDQKPTFITEIETNLEERLGTRVVITPGKKKGLIQIEYYNNDDLDRIIEKINR